MKIDVTLSVDNDADVDDESTTGLTQAAYDRLYDALTSAGFEIDEGPDVAVGA